MFIVLVFQRRYKQSTHAHTLTRGLTHLYKITYVPTHMITYQMEHKFNRNSKE